MSEFFSRLFDRFMGRQTMTWSASLAFYTSLSFAPLLMIFLSIISSFSKQFGDNFIQDVSNLVGPEAALSIQMIVENAKNRQDLQGLSGVLGFIVLVISASFVFGELRAALNYIFEIDTSDLPLNQRKDLLSLTKKFFRDRIAQMGLVFGFIFIMIVSLFISSFISLWFQNGNKIYIVQLFNILVSTALYIAVFTILFRYLPEKRLPWKQCFHGGAITAALFVIGKELIGFYLGHRAIGSSYGAAGSIIVLLSWVYYSSLVTFLGAHISFLLNIIRKEQEAPKYEKEIII